MNDKNLGSQKNKLKEIKRTPELRFKGFSDDWEQRKLGDLSTSFEYGLNASAKGFDGINKYIRITDIDDSSRKFNHESLTSPDIDLSSADNYKLKDGDILFARTGASVGKTYIYTDSDGLVYYAGFLIRARIKSGVDSNFVFQHTLTSSYENFIRVISQRSGQPGVNAKEYSIFEIGVPSYEEQHKIGTFFKQLDSTITLHQRKLDKLKQLKQGYLQQLFPKPGETVPKIRFANFESEWEERKLKDIIISETKGKAKAEMYGTASPYLETNYLNGGEISYVNSPKNVDEDDVIILWDGSQAGTVYHGFKGALGSTLKAYSPKESGKFLYQYLKLKQQVIYDSYRTPNIPHVIKTFAKEFNVHFTCYEEQNKIGILLNQLDETTALYQSKIDKLKLLKKGFLQKMFI